MKNKLFRLFYILFLLLLNFSLLCCTDRSSKSDTSANNTATDTITTQKQTSPDTPITTEKSRLNLPLEDDDSSFSTSQILKDELSSYKDTLKIDTTFVMNSKDTMTVELRHYCTYDKKIDLPVQYLTIYNLTKFQTHDFITSLKFKMNSKTIFNSYIRKADFEKLLDGPLKEYGVLLYPDIESSSKGLSLRYSISVPLSDVGNGFTILIDTSGNKHVYED